MDSLNAEFRQKLARSIKWIIDKITWTLVGSVAVVVTAFVFWMLAVAIYAGYLTVNGLGTAKIDEFSPTILKIAVSLFICVVGLWYLSRWAEENS